MDIGAVYAKIAVLQSYIKLDNIVSVLLGAFISGYISYRFLKKRERDKLKKDLQLKATEQILDEIRIVNDKSSMLFIPDLASFEGYNSILEFVQSNKPQEDDLVIVKKTVEELNTNQLQWSKDRILKCMNDFFEIWKEYSYSYCRFINLFETKQIILNRFIGIKDLLGEQLTEIMDIESRIMHFYHFDINPCVTYSNPISNELINEMQALNNELMEKRVDISSIFYDFTIELQNEFLGELFAHEIPSRQPVDTVNHPVYKAGYKHMRKQEMRL